MSTIKYVAYYRVSTKKQGQSGLGLEAQQEQVRSFVNCSDCILAEFTEVESGKKDNRPQLAEAIATAKELGAKLVIAKLDRLSRNASFIFSLRDSQVDFVAVDMPEANNLTIGIMAVLAQDERERISQRTKAALKAKKAQGVKLGTPDNLNTDAIAKGQEVRKANAMSNQNNKQATELISLYREKGLSMSKIADKLNDQGYKSRRGGKFYPSTVKMLLDRASA